VRIIPLKAIIVSRNFNPGHYSHLVANYKLLSESGIDTFMYHHASFNKMGVIGSERIYNNIFELKKLGKIDVAIFWFPSLTNIIDIIFLRLFYRTRVVYVFHEPLESASSYLAAGFGLLRTFRILLIGQVNYLLVLLSNKIILPSIKAYSIFETNYLSTNKKYELIPLLFDDEAAHINIGSNRSFISYIGTIAEDHAFDEYVKFVIQAINNNWFQKYTFLIATKSNVPLAQRSALSAFVTSGKVVIHEGRPMSNAEINNHYNNSIVVWNAYRRSMQSGVLPKAYMFGTPLLVSSCNSSEFFADRQHGVIVDGKYDAEELKAAIEDVVVNFEKYSSFCREKFLSTFYYKAHENTFVEFVLDGMKCESK
jgi:hypothetical protein